MKKFMAGFVSGIIFVFIMFALYSGLHIEVTKKNNACFYTATTYNAGHKIVENEIHLNNDDVKPIKIWFSL